MSEQPKWEKMAKSKGNVITPDEVIYGVSDLASGYEFRLPQVVKKGEEFFLVVTSLNDYKEWGVWLDKLKDSMFYTRR